MESRNIIGRDIEMAELQRCLDSKLGANWVQL